MRCCIATFPCHREAPMGSRGDPSPHLSASVTPRVEEMDCFTPEGVRNDASACSCEWEDL